MSLVAQSASQCDCLDCRMEASFADFGGGRSRKTIPRLKSQRQFKPPQRTKASTMIEKLKSPPEFIPRNCQFPGSLPFNIFPVPRDAEVAPAVQYYFEVFACSIHPHYEDAPEAWRGSSFWSDRLQIAMADPMWFCAMIAFVEAAKGRTLHDSFEKTSVIIKYQSKAFMDLRKRLLSDISDKDNDLLLLTVTVLMSIDIAFGTLDSLKMHAEGLERIIQLRGGLESLNSNPYLKHKVIGFQLFWLSKQMAHATKSTTAVYPKHPFPSDLCINVSKLPPDLSELALEGTLNIAMIRLTADMASIQSKFNKDGHKRPEDLRRLKLLGYEMEELLKLRGVNQIERLICAALCDYSTCLDDDRPQHWLLGGALRMNISPLWCRGVRWEKRYSKMLIWAGSMLAACSEAGSITFRLGTDVLHTCADHHHELTATTTTTLDREFALQTCRAFIWDEVLTEKLGQKFDFDCFAKTPARSSSGSRSSSTATSTTGSVDGGCR